MKFYQRTMVGVVCSACLMFSSSGCGTPANSVGNAAGYGGRMVGNVIGQAGKAAGDAGELLSNTVGDAGRAGRNAMQGKSTMSTSSPYGTMTEWVQLNSNTHVVNLNVSTNQMAHQKVPTHRALNITVPRGWMVDITMHNQGQVHHSLLIVPVGHKYAKNAASANKGGQMQYLQGTAQRTNTFVFKARSAGHFTLVCTLPGHVDGVLANLYVADTQSPIVSTR